MHEMRADIVIVGGGTGGCAAALAAARSGCRVIMTEETAWIGGQLTSQAVPPDEHRWIESFGCTRSYRTFRDGVRAYYREHYPLTPAARATWNLNPGNGNVSRLCHEPRVALAVLYQMLMPYVASGRVQILLHHKPVAADVEGDFIRSVEVESTHTGRRLVLQAPYILYATELGDLLPLAGVEYVTGAESQRETGEPHAVSGDPEPLNMQAISHCFALDYIEGEDFTIPKPEQYDFWREYQAPFLHDKLLSWTGTHPVTLEPRKYSLFPTEGAYSLWHYRRIVDKNNFAEGTFASDITLVNWPQMDYWLGPIIEVSEEEAAKHREGAKQLSLSLLYSLQTEAPRPDGGTGYPGLRLRGDVVGNTEDGLAMYPYIRESRRIKAVFTVLEQHVAADVRGEHGAEQFFDSVGIGSYRIDLHPSTGGDDYIDISSLPFQIPLGALLPVRMRNLLPACKNLGVTHITNGCYRLHPVEWNIGEAAGYLAAFCLSRNTAPHAVRENEELLQDFQRMLVQAGIELAWPKVHAV